MCLFAKPLPVGKIDSITKILQLCECRRLAFEKLLLPLLSLKKRFKFETLINEKATIISFTIWKKRRSIETSLCWRAKNISIVFYTALGNTASWQSDANYSFSKANRQISHGGNMMNRFFKWAIYGLFHYFGLLTFLKFLTYFCWPHSIPGPLPTVAQQLPH